MRKDSDQKKRELMDRLGRPSIAVLNREIARRSRMEAFGRLAAIVLVILLTSASLIIISTNLWVNVLQIEGTSMNPLLQADEIILTARDGKFERGDVIAFEHHNRLHVKRVIATGGDTVEIGEDGTVTVNGEPLHEPHVSELSLGNCDIAFPYQIPVGTVFVLGDNRPLSVDSRDSGFGTVGKEQVIGKVLFRLWPLPQFGSI